MLNSVRIPVNCTVTSHMACTSTDAADDVRCEVTLFGAVVLPVANIATILADLVLVIAKRTVERSEFSELIAFMVVLSFGSRSRLRK